MKQVVLGSSPSASMFVFVLRSSVLERMPRVGSSPGQVLFLIFGFVNGCCICTRSLALFSKPTAVHLCWNYFLGSGVEWW